MVFTVYVPSNSGLQYVREQGLIALPPRVREWPRYFLQEERGEDIPDRVYTNKELAFGITGEDLVKECLLARDPTVMAASKTSIPLNLAWSGSYADSMFGLPTLCVLGKGGIEFDEFKKAYGDNVTRKTIPNLQQKRVVIPGRYERLISSLVQQDDVKYITLDGNVDVTAATDSSIDYAIDIVLSGRTCIQEGLGIFATLFKSDGVLVYNRFSPLQNLINYRALTREDKP